MDSILPQPKPNELEGTRRATVVASLARMIVAELRQNLEQRPSSTQTLTPAQSPGEPS
jgi:hypothetical protein